MLFFKIDKEYWKTLITFLIYIGRMPEKIEQHGIYSSEFAVDENVASVLRKI
jgi:hypothetical protein